MGIKGSNTTNTNQTQTYTPNPVVGNAGTQAINMAQNAAGQPFNLPVAPVAGFTPQQQQAFQQYSDLQGLAQPYYNQAQNYLNQSATPLTAAQINNYYNPMASSVLANLQETQGQQMNDLTGRLTQTAGGVGADRIAVGQSELARQQQLATGQTLSGLYQNALQAAQQNQQMQANAAYGLTNLGTTAQGAALQGTAALFGAGNLQQTQEQNLLNAQYQNQLAQLAYPFQTAQYLAGITGGLSGALGGTTTGYGQTTQPAPSIWSQLLGGGAAIAGGLGASGAFGNNGWLTGGPSYGGGNAFTDAYGGSSTNPLQGLSPSDYGAGFADGGATSPFANPDWMHSDAFIPNVEVRSQANPGAKLDLNPKVQSSDSSSPLGSLASLAKIGAMFLKDGGAVDASNPFQSFADGGDASFDERFDAVNDPTSFEDRYTDSLRQIGQPALRNGWGTPIGPQSPTTPVPDLTQPPVGSPDNPYRMPDQAENGPTPYQGWQASADAANGPAMALASNRQMTPIAAAAARGEPSPQVSRSDYASLSNQLPFPDINNANDESRQFSKSPWLALINAGAAMMAGTSPFAGVNIGKGLEAGVKTLEDQRKQTTEEASVNERAKQLMQQAEFHIDQYNKIPAAEQARLENQREVNKRMIAQMNLKNWVLANDNPVSGEKTWMQQGTGNFRTMKTNPDGSITVTTGSMDDPNSWRTTTSRNGVTTTEKTPKSEQPPPPMGMPELASDVVPPEGAVNQNMFRKGSPAMNQATAELKAQTALNTKEAQAASGQKILLDETKAAYGVLMKDRDQDGFLTKLATMKGNNFEERLRYARSLNEAATAAGRPPIINPDKVAAMEVISKTQRTMGMMFAGNISAREAWAGQQAAIESTPGLTQSPQGMLKLIATFDAMNQYGEARRAFFNNYVQKYGVSSGWEKAFAEKNPIDRFVVRAMMEDNPNRQAAERLKESVEELRRRRNDPEAIRKFNKYYGNTASYWLTGHLDMLGAQ